MDEESIVTIREELSNDFYALAKTQIEAVRKLLDRLEDDQLDTQLQFERYERECQRKEAERRVEAINISDEEQLAEPQPQPQPQPELQPKGAENEQMKESRTEHPEGARAEQQQQKEEEPLEPLDQSILDILDEDWWS